ncbi:hypothetical protein [Streptomyces sp. Qhu_M48]|uniref:hypothetical protein n=1 Tax=Streptomyces sp. Qhu_M48 TaxID=3435889 RepID=UPI003F50C17A
MTPTAHLPAPPPGAALRPSTARRTLRVLAIVACLPYVSLKVAWVAGSRIGIPAGSVLLENPRTMAVANSLTVLADVLVVVLALLLTQGWGRRVPAPLLVLPMWGATGLLTPIMTGYPTQLLVAVVTGDDKAAAPSEPFLDPWVFVVVYGGFILQGLTLGTLFALYARDRWGQVWRGRLGERPALGTAPWVRTTALAGAVLALGSAALHLMWASGATAGLSARQSAERDADFYVLEAQWVAFVAVAVASVLLLVLDRPARLRVRPVLALAWIAPASVGCWGAYMSLVALLPTSDPAKRVTPLMQLSYAGDMIIGLLLGACVAAFLRRRSAGA